MSSTTTTTYNFGFSVNQGEVNEAGSVEFTTATGMTDEAALQFVEAFKNLPWPVGAGASASVTKHVRTDVQTEGNTTTGTFA